jgi:hypothetical protein
VSEILHCSRSTTTIFVKRLLVMSYKLSFGARSMSFSIRAFLPFWCKEHVILNTSIPFLLVQGACHSQYEHSFPFGARSMSFSIRAFLPFWYKEHAILNTSIPSLLVQGACHSQYQHSFPFGARSMSFSIPAFLPFWCKEYVINDYQYEHSFPMAYVKHRL